VLEENAVVWLALYCAALEEVLAGLEDPVVETVVALHGRFEDELRNGRTEDALLAVGRLFLSVRLPSRNRVLARGLDASLALFQLTLHSRSDADGATRATVGRILADDEITTGVAAFVAAVRVRDSETAIRCTRSLMSRIRSLLPRDEEAG
jgi:DNA-binding GntR family transcriptional regulator